MLLFSHRRFLDGVKTAGKADVSIAQLKTLATAQGKDYIVSFLNKASIKEQVEVKAYLKQGKKEPKYLKDEHSQIGQQNVHGMTPISVYVDDVRQGFESTDDVDSTIEKYKNEYPGAEVEYTDGLLEIRTASKKTAALVFGEERKAIAEDKGNAFGLEGKDRTIASEDQKKIYTPKKFEALKDNEERRNFRNRQKIETWNPETSDVKAGMSAIAEALKAKPDFPEILGRSEKEPVAKREKKGNMFGHSLQQQFQNNLKNTDTQKSTSLPEKGKVMVVTMEDGSTKDVVYDGASDIVDILNKEAIGWKDWNWKDKVASVKQSSLNIEINPREVGGFELKINGKDITLADSFQDAVQTLNREFERYPNQYEKQAKEKSASKKTADGMDYGERRDLGETSVLELYPNGKFVLTGETNLPADTVKRILETVVQKLEIKKMASKKTAGYYDDELNNVLPADKYGVQVQFKSTKGSTKWMNVNDEFLAALDSIKEKLLPKTASKKTASLAEQLDGAKLIKHDPNSGLVFAWFGGTGVNIYDETGYEVDYFSFPEGYRTVEAVTKMIEEHIAYMSKTGSKKVATEFPFSTEDNLLDGFTYQELIDTIINNEEVRDGQAVERVFEELIQNSVANADELLNTNLKKVLLEISAYEKAGSKKTAEKDSYKARYMQQNAQFSAGGSTHLEAELKKYFEGTPITVTWKASNLLELNLNGVKEEDFANNAGGKGIEGFNGLVMQFNGDYDYPENGKVKIYPNWRRSMGRKKESAIEPAAAPEAIATPATGVPSSNASPQNLGENKKAEIVKKTMTLEGAKEKTADNIDIQLGQPMTIKDPTGMDKRVVPTEVDPNTKTITMVPEGTETTTIKQQ